VQQVPFVQVPLQGRLQPPQCARSLAVSTHAPPQTVWLASQHNPDLHVLLHARLHPPQ